jgi:anti-sigma regulatory factor (Ser/Thr protein kinase)
MDIPEDVPYVALTRALGRTTLQHMQVAPVDVVDLETILDELCSNVVRHAQSKQGRFQLKLEYYADRVVVTVKDKGNGFLFADIPPPGTVRADLDGEDRVGGFGLIIVGAVGDRLQFHRSDGQGTTVIAEKRLTYQDQAAAERAEDLDAEEGSLTAGRS